MIRKHMARRKLIVHQAHSIVGVTGEAPAVRPYCCMPDEPTHSLLTMPTQLCLAAWRGDANAQAAATAFERLVADRDDLVCSRVMLDAVAADLASLAQADGIVLFDRGLQIVRHEADLTAPVRAEGGFVSTGNEIRVETSHAAMLHPVLDGVDSFTFESRHSGGASVPEDATVLLTGVVGIRTRPLAWVRHRRHGRVFCTPLGIPSDFARPEFARLVVNALDWVVG